MIVYSARGDKIMYQHLASVWYNYKDAKQQRYKFINVFRELQTDFVTLQYSINCDVADSVFDRTGRPGESSAWRDGIPFLSTCDMHMFHWYLVNSYVSDRRFST